MSWVRITRAILFFAGLSFSTAYANNFVIESLYNSDARAEYDLGEDFEDEFTVDLNFQVTRLCPFSADLAKQAKYQKPSGSWRADYIVVDKKRKIMHFMSDGKVFRTYKVALGSSKGKKRKEGDKKTPEGVYTIGYRNSQSSFYLSLHVTYPNTEDRDWARRNGVSPGGDIMIHGLPNESWKHPWLGHPSRNWTAGCVAVTNAEMDEVWQYVIRGTVIEFCSET